MIRIWVSVAAAALALAACGDGGAARKSGSTAPQVWAAGSSTVFPFATRVAENVARTTGHPAGKVEALGTGGGIKLFCGGQGNAYPDVATASRQMKKSEFEQCAANGVANIIELKIGYDGLVVAHDITDPTFDMTLEDLYRGLAAELPAAGGAFARNAAVNWSDVRAGLPASRIVVYGPPPTSGTRDSFVELGMEGGARKLPAMAALKASDEDAFKAKSHALRTDGAWIDAGENDNAVVQTLTKTPGALGAFGYSFLDNNRDKVKAVKLDGVEPTLVTIADGSYPLARSLFIYVKKDRMAVVPGLKPYVDAFISDAAAGTGGYLQERGLVPLPKAEHDAQKAVAAAGTVMSAPAS
ncbi:MAG: substrate-binding domain-containing protein [Caulobacteraceae bacterium]|nr:substrate-binding domain-containing protein [Caulobacteraceae bacterium]